MRNSSEGRHREFSDLRYRLVKIEARIDQSEAKDRPGPSMVQTGPSMTSDGSLLDQFNTVLRLGL